MTHKLLTTPQRPAVDTEACVLQLKEGYSIHRAQQEVPEQGPQLATLTSEAAKGSSAGPASRSRPRGVCAAHPKRADSLVGLSPVHSTGSVTTTKGPFGAKQHWIHTKS